jgi:alpha-aminoadipate carrier protein LysW
VSYCPECEAVIDEEFEDVGEVISCPECGVELEVISIDPVEFDLAPIDDEEDDEFRFDDAEEEEEWDEEDAYEDDEDEEDDDDL